MFPMMSCGGSGPLAHLAARYALHSVQLAIYAPLFSTAEMIEYLPLLRESDLHTTFKDVVESLQQASGSST